MTLPFLLKYFENGPYNNNKNIYYIPIASVRWTNALNFRPAFPALFRDLTVLVRAASDRENTKK